MKGNLAKDLAQELLQIAGITINGNQPWDMQVNNNQTFVQALQKGNLGLGEAYIQGWWDCEKLDDFFYRIIRSGLAHKVYEQRYLLKVFLLRLFNFQTKHRALEVGKKHYDLGNLLFECMLDSHMNYTCGYWKNASNLEEAQLAKLALVCQKLMLKPGMRILDIGCGWGSLAKYAAKNYGVSVVGITISHQQKEFAERNCQGLPIEIRFQDYRDVNEPFDRIVSLGMFEHVGHLNYRTYMETVHRCLVENGLFLLHSLGANQTSYTGDTWLTKYIFPNGMVPSIAQIGKATEGLFVMEDWHNFGADYTKTLLAWHENFNNNWETRLKQYYDSSFQRMWNYYLLSCAGTTRARDLQLWQVVFSKNGVLNGYQAPR